MSTFSFVIPTYNHYNLLHATLYDIYQKCSPVHEVIVVDDCSTDQDYHDGLEWWKSNGMLPVRHIRMKENSMFLKASNAGLKRATGDIICLLSNDVRIHKDIVLDITGMVRAYENCLIGGRYLDFDTGWNTFGSVMFPYLEGWLLATSRKNWEELGYFDVQYAPSDMEDVDLSATARMRGYHLLPLSPTSTTHIGGQSIGFNPEREKITIANKEKFRQKWLE